MAVQQLPPAQPPRVCPLLWKHGTPALPRSPPWAPTAPSPPNAVLIAHFRLGSKGGTWASILLVSGVVYIN